MSGCRHQIVRDFARWTALSALRSGAPIKSRADIYPLLDQVRFDDVLRGSEPITSVEFDAWHKAATDSLRARDPRVAVGWATKLINVYLKTAGYVGGVGRPRLNESLHPPIDSGLWAGFAKRFGDTPAILDEVCCVRLIKNVTDYATYARIIRGCRLAAAKLGCLLIEVEQLWLGAATPSGVAQGQQSPPRSGT